jgi:hypothetical protein
MTVKLFNQIALEDNESVDPSDITNYKDDVIALDNNLRGIDFAMEQISTLSKIKSILLKNKDRKLNKSSIKIGKLAIENITKSLSIYHEVSAVSTENFNEATVSTESIVSSIVETIKKIWDSIVKTFKAIWEKIISFFSGSKTRNNNDVSRARRTEKEFKDIQEEIVKNEIVLPEMPEVIPVQFIKPLNYLNKTLTDLDLLDHIKIVTDLGQQLKYFIDEIEGTHSIINQTIHSMEPVMDQDPVGASGVYMIAEEMMLSGIMAYINNLGQVNESQANIRKHLNEIIPQDSKIDSTSVRILNKLNYGAGICFYALIGDPVRFNCHITVVQNCYEDSDKVSFKIPDNTNMDLFANRVLELAKVNKELNEHAEDKVKSIKNYHTKIITFLENNQKNINQSNEDILVKNFNYIKDLTNVILQMAVNSSKSFETYSNTVHYFTELNEYFKRHYQEVVKKALA